MSQFYSVHVPDFDLPNARLILTGWLTGSGAVVESGDPLCEICAGDILIEIDAVLDAMDRAKMRDSMKRILRSVPYCIVDFTDPDRFRNVNSQEDLEG